MITPQEFLSLRAGSIDDLLSEIDKFLRNQKPGLPARLPDDVCDKIDSHKMDVVNEKLAPHWKLTFQIDNDRYSKSPRSTFYRIQLYDKNEQE